MSRVSGTHYEGPLLGDERSMGGALEDAPIELFARSKWVTYFNDFTNIDKDYLTTTDFSLTQVSGGGSASVITGANLDMGVLRLDCPADEDGPIIQFDASASAGSAVFGITPAAAVAGTSVATDAIFAARFRILDVSAQGVFVGLAELNSTTAIKATPEGAITSDTHIGFAQLDSSNGALFFTVAGDDDTAATTSTTGIGTLTDSEWIEIAVRATGTNRARGYIRRDGSNTKWKRVADVVLASGNTWDAQMLMSLANIGGGAGDDLDVDYIFLAVLRDLTS